MTLFPDHFSLAFTTERRRQPNRARRIWPKSGAHCTRLFVQPSQNLHRGESAAGETVGPGKPCQLRNLIAGQGLPFETLCIESCLTAVVVVTGGLAVGHGVFERDPGDLERLQECWCRVTEHLVGVSAAS